MGERVGNGVGDAAETVIGGTSGVLVVHAVVGGPDGRSIFTTAASGPLEVGMTPSPTEQRRACL